MTNPIKRGMATYDLSPQSHIRPLIDMRQCEATQPTCETKPSCRSISQLVRRVSRTGQERGLRYPSCNRRGRAMTIRAFRWNLLCMLRREVGRGEKMNWSGAAQTAMREALDALPECATPDEKLKAIDAAYPFGMRRNYPYKVWLSERKHMMMKIGCMPKQYAPVGGLPLSPLEKAKEKALL